MSVVALVIMLAAGVALWGLRDGNWFTILFLAGLAAQFTAVIRGRHKH